MNDIHEILSRSARPLRFCTTPEILRVSKAWKAKHNILENVRPREDHSVHNAPLRTKQGFYTDTVVVIVVDSDFREQRADGHVVFSFPIVECHLLENFVIDDEAAQGQLLESSERS